MGYLQGLLDTLKVPNVLIDGFTVNTLVIVVVILMFVLGFLALRARGLLSKIVAIVTVMVSVPSIVLAVSEQLSYAKPLTIEWFEANVHGDGLHVYGTTVDPGVDIHLWVASEDGKSNRLFSLPWTQGLNDSLEAAARALALGGGELRLKKDPSKADDEQGPLMFYPEAWPEPPPKDGGPEVQPRVFVPNVVA